MADAKIPVGVQIGAAFLLFFLTIVAGIVPSIFIKYWRKRKQTTIFKITDSQKSYKFVSLNSIVKLLMYFGGGVLLATCFIHLIPEVREKFDNYYEHHKNNNSGGSSDHDHDHGRESALDYLGIGSSGNSPGTGAILDTAESSAGHPHEHLANEHGHDHDHSHDGHNDHALEPTDHNDHDHDHNGTEVPPHGDHSGHNHDEEPSASAGHSGHNHNHGKEGHGGHEHSHGVPYVELAICGGFFVIYLLEEIVHLFIPHSHDHESNGDDKSTHDDHSSHGSDHSEDRLTEVDGSNPSLHAIPPSTPPGDNFLNSTIPPIIAPYHYNPKSKKEGTIDDGYINYGMEIDAQSQAAIDPTRLHQALAIPTISKEISVPIQTRIQSIKSETKSIRFIQGFVVILAFSAHSIFDGVAIGIQDKNDRLWTMFFAICSHKLVVAFAVGMELLEKTSSLTMTIIHMSLFSLMSPIGIFIVILTQAKTSGESDSPVIILLSAVATGTILYIVFFEILQRDKSKDASKLTGLILYFSMICGFTVMFFLTLYVVH